MSNLFEKKVISWKTEENEIILQYSFEPPSWEFTPSKVEVYSD